MAHTLDSIAKLAGVSRGTVSRIVNGHPGVKPHARERVLRIIEETGYQPNVQARSLAGGKTFSIGVAVFGESSDILAHHLFYEVMQGIQRQLTQHDYDLLLYSNRAEADRDYWRRIGDKRKVDGLIVMGEHIREEFLTYYREKGLPFVLVGKRSFHELPLVCVTSNYSKGAYEGVRHLIGREKRRIVFLCGDLSTYHEEEKLRGYRLALEENGIRYEPSLVVDGKARREDARREMAELLGREGQTFDAVFCGNDLMAFGAMDALHERGLQVPSDVAVVGYDDIHPAAYSTPSLTTISQNKRQLGERATELLMRMLHGELKAQSDCTVMVDGALVVRES